MHPCHGIPPDVEVDEWNSPNGGLNSALDLRRHTFEVNLLRCDRKIGARESGWYSRVTGDHAGYECSTQRDVDILFPERGDTAGGEEGRHDALATGDQTMNIVRTELGNESAETSTSVGGTISYRQRTIQIDGRRSESAVPNTLQAHTVRLRCCGAH
jgi:hypothetical protein